MTTAELRDYLIELLSEGGEPADLADKILETLETNEVTER